jgi:trimeric autotransporter adhesin
MACAPVRGGDSPSCDTNHEIQPHPPSVCTRGEASRSLVSNIQAQKIRIPEGVIMRTVRFEIRWLLSLSVAAMLAGCDDGRFSAFGGNAPPGNMTGTPGNTFALTTTGRLLTFDRATPTTSTAVAITGLQNGEVLLGIDIRPGGATPGQLYALGSSGRLYTIDPSSGTATLKSTLSADPTDATNPFTALSGVEYGVDFNPVVDRLRIVSDNGLNLRVNVDSGATITDGPLNVGGTTRNGVTTAAYTNSFAATCRTTLFFIDTAADRLLTTADPNAGTVTEVGALGLDGAAISAFEIATASSGTNEATAVFSVGTSVNVYTINLTTGAATLNGSVTGLGSNEQIRGITLAPPTTAPANALGQMVATTETNKLISFTTAAPQKLCTSATITGLQSGESILGIDTRPADGAVYALGNSGRIYTVDTGTGAATLKSSLSADPADTMDPFTALSGTEYGVDFNPVPDRLRVVSDTGQNLRINVDTGAVTTDTPLNPVGSVAVGAAYTNAFAGAGFTTLYILDAANDRLQIQGQPSGNPNLGDLAPVGPLNITGDVQAVAAFDIAGVNNAAWAAVNLAGAPTSELHSVNLATGAATRVNTIGGGERIRGAALVAIPAATVFAATVDNRLVSFKPNTPGTFDTNTAFTGLQGGEIVLGIDFRQTNGRLYAATNSGRIYTVDPATGAATLASTLMADGADTTNPFAGLDGTATGFGVDFNPVADRLRIVSSTGQNLRINVDTGLVTTDAALNPGGPQVVAVAYKQSFPAPAATQLLDIDLATNSLLLQNPPNDGTLTPVGGVLDPALTFSSNAGFDIGGGDDGLSIAALQPTGSAQSVLYRLNLKTGALTQVGALGPSGTPLIRALAVRVK